MPERVVAEAPAKVNLRLRVLAREASGFHSLETIFCAISLADTVEVRRGPAGIVLRGPGVERAGPPENNLIVRATERFCRAAGISPAVECRLEKRIPAAAGLGGGSSDAAATLRALNALHGEPLGKADLFAIAGQLGSDVPFFLCGSPLALAWGRGERLLALPPLPARPLLVANPGVPFPTPDAFGALSARGAPQPQPWTAQIGVLRSWQGMAALAENDFTSVAAARLPTLPAALELLREAGARPALLSGSGPSVFGVFHSERERARATVALRELGWHTWEARTLRAEAPLRVDPPRVSV